MCPERGLRGGGLQEARRRSLLRAQDPPHQGSRRKDARRVGRSLYVSPLLIQDTHLGAYLLMFCSPGTLDREGNARKVVNCSCVVVKDWGEESQERSVLLNYFQTEQ